jgi:hypothetical protein
LVIVQSQPGEATALLDHEQLGGNVPADESIDILRVGCAMNRDPIAPQICRKKIADN